MEKHPDQCEAEIWLTNCATPKEFDSLGWRTKRKGRVAFDSEGRPLPAHFPVFITPSEEDPAAVELLQQFCKSEHAIGDNEGKVLQSV